MLDLGYWPLIAFVVLLGYGILQALYFIFEDSIILYFKKRSRKQ